MSLESLLKRDRRIVLSSIAILTVLAWIYLLQFAGNMKMTASMPDMPHMPNMAPMFRTWTATDFALIFVMWAVMMVGMMTPSSAPMILIYARVARQAAINGKPLASTGWFAMGYLFCWTLFSVAASIAQGALEHLAWVTPMMSAANNRIGGAVLVVAGIYQFTALKNVCLAHCQSPFAFLQQHGGFKPGLTGALRLGFHHGIYCVGCCWALMAVLFAVGVMNIFWVAVVSVIVLIEKTIPAGRWIARVTGAGLVLTGIGLMIS